MTDFYLKRQPHPANCRFGGKFGRGNFEYPKVRQWAKMRSGGTVRAMSVDSEFCLTPFRYNSLNSSSKAFKAAVAKQAPANSDLNHSIAA